MRVTGDGAAALRKMGDLLRIVEMLSDVPARTAAIASPQLDRLVRQQFANGTDPYGRPWAPLKPATLARGRRPPPLTASGRLAAGTGVKVRPGKRAGLVFKIGAPYGTFHQTGTRYMQARRILPQQGLPREWRRILTDASRAACQSIELGGARE
jgi:hypothetical protein